MAARQSNKFEDM